MKENSYMRFIISKLNYELRNRELRFGVAASWSLAVYTIFTVTRRK
jgi:hypothetical protein